MQTWTDDQIKASLRKGGYHRERALEYMFKAWFSALHDEAKRTGLGQEDAEEIAADAIWALRNEILNTSAEEIPDPNARVLALAKYMVWIKTIVLESNTLENSASENSASENSALVIRAFESDDFESGESFMSLYLEKESGLGQILDALRPDLLSVARGFRLRQQDAEDVVQDVIYELIRRLRNTSLDEIQDIKAYGITVTQKKAMTFIEKWTNQRRAYWYDPCYYYDLYNILHWQEVKNEVEKMAEPCRSIILKKGEGYSSSEIADYTKLAISTVRNKIRPCREELYRRLREKPQS
jgi:DNA-directed RNA polymerase specialized sigma24 family protein